MSRKKSSIETKNLKNIGDRIRQLRKSLFLDQAPFGKLLGLSSNFVSDLELGKAPPTMPVLLLIESRWSITPNQILTGNGFSIERLHEINLAKGITEAIENTAYSPQPNLFKMYKAVLTSQDDLKNLKKDVVELKEEIRKLGERLARQSSRLAKHVEDFVER